MVLLGFYLLRLLSRLKTGLICLAVSSTGFYRGWIFFLLLALDRWILCTALYGGGNRLLLLPHRPLHRAVSLLCPPYICRSPLCLISPGRAEAAGHSISTRCMLSERAAPFFLQRHRKQPKLPTCHEEMSHGQPLDFSHRRFSGPAPRPRAQTVCLHVRPEPHLKAAASLCGRSSLNTVHFLFLLDLFIYLQRVSECKSYIQKVFIFLCCSFLGSNKKFKACSCRFLWKISEMFPHFDRRPPVDWTHVCLWRVPPLC